MKLLRAKPALDRSITIDPGTPGERLCFAPIYCIQYLTPWNDHTTMHTSLTLQNTCGRSHGEMQDTYPLHPTYLLMPAGGSNRIFL